MQRILVVDDEAMIRTLVGRALRKAGYEVEEAEDGLAGWECFSAAELQFDLVVTDSRLPHLSGSELVQRLREIHPTLPIINLSGSHGDRTTPDYSLPPNVPILSKPFQLSKLVTLVRELLNSPQH
jgi:DNA-binding response OmpR family regulator